jgi:hypothetical protein
MTISNLACLLALGVVSGTLVMALADWQSRPATPVMTYEDAMREAESNDPKVGLSLKPLLGKHISESGLTLIVLLGDCNSCSITSAPIPPPLLTRFTKIVQVARVSKADAHLIPKQIMSSIIVNDERISPALNAYFTPRLALADSSYRLVALQERDETPSQFLGRNQ